MLETRSLPQEIRLRRGARVRATRGRGIAVSAGEVAVVLDGAAGESLWSAVEPALRRGVTRESLLHAVPAAARSALVKMLDELDRQGLIREVEPSCADGPALEHFEAVTRRPVAATRCLADCELRVAGRGRLVAVVAQHLRDAGAARVAEAVEAVQAAEAVDPDARCDLLVERRDGGGWLPVVCALGNGVYSIVGPRNRDLEPGDVEAVVRCLQRGHSTQSRRGLHDALVAAQVALLTLGSIARSVEDAAPTATWQEYLVTNTNLVAEPRPCAILPSLCFSARSPQPAPSVPLAPTVPIAPTAALAQLEPLWDTVLGVIAEPQALDLSQLPVALAVATREGDATIAGIGVTTAEARLDAVFELLRCRQERMPHAAFGIGETTMAARIAAFVSLIDAPADSTAEARRDDGDGPADTRWVEVEARCERLSALGRRLHAALTLRFGHEVVVAAATHTRLLGLLRAEVVVDGVMLGRAYATEPEHAVVGALLRATGAVQLRHDPNEAAAVAPVVRALAARCIEGAEALDAWIQECEELRVLEPVGAQQWRRAHLETAVVSWRF